MRRLNDAAYHLKFAEESFKAAVDEGELDPATQVHVDKLRTGIRGARRITRNLASGRRRKPPDRRAGPR